MKEENTVSSAEMKEIERIADGNGLTYRQMMENAGTAAYEVIRPVSYTHLDVYKRQAL